MTPTYVEPFLGMGSVWLHLVDPGLVPPVSFMGGKRRFAGRILSLLGLTPGRPPEAILGDASWLGWVWPLILDPVTGPAVSAWLRSWRDEDPRALWFRLRDEGPAADPVERAAGLLWLQARAASGVPVWWEGDDDGAALTKWDRTRTGHVGPANQAHAAERLVMDDGVRAACGKGYITGERSLRAGGRADRPAGSTVAGHKGHNAAGTGGIVDPGTVAGRLDAVRARLVKASGGEAGYAPSVSVHHGDALDLVSAVAPELGASGRYYLDPPYLGATGYPASCPRDRVLAIAEECARYGGRVVLSEAVSLAADLGAGWSSVQLRAGRRPEWVTTRRCDVGAAIGPLFARGAA